MKLKTTHTSYTVTFCYFAKTFLSNRRVLYILLLLSCLLLSLFWFRGGFQSLYFDTDLGRDLSELSNIWNHHIVWIGPRLGPGFQASPSYYYFLFPFLVLGRGNAEALIAGNLLFGLVTLLLWGGLALRKWGGKALLAVGILGLVPWWTQNILHPGNGYTYIFWVFAGLTCLWFDLPLFISALCLGMAVSFHPAAIFALPILAYEWWRHKHQIKQLLLVLIGLAIPEAPIILFEIITKGYLTREWLAQSGQGIQLHLNLGNWQQIGTSLGIPLVILIIAGVYLFTCVNRRLKMWMILSALASLPFLFVDVLPIRYLFGLVVLVSFVLITACLEHKRGLWLLIPWFLLIFVTGVIFRQPMPPATRTVPGVQAVADQFVAQTQLDRSKKIAVVAALTPTTEVPQADDYRFFLRIKGLSVLEVQQYAQADYLIEFIEVPNFSWQTWSTWEIQQIGQKRIIEQETIGQTQIIVFQKT